MNRIVVLCAIFLMASVCRMDAQDVKVVAKELMAGSEVDFSCFVTGNDNQNFSFEATGTAKLLGKSYNILTEEGLKFISDGKSLWIINLDTQEAVVSLLDESSAAQNDFTNPFVLLSNPQGELKFSFKGTAPGGNPKVPAEIKISGFKSGQPKEIVVRIAKYAKANLSGSDFVFNKKDYPSIDVTDLR